MPKILKKKCYSCKDRKVIHCFSPRQWAKKNYKICTECVQKKNDNVYTGKSPADIKFNDFQIREDYVNIGREEAEIRIRNSNSRK